MITLPLTRGIPQEDEVRIVLAAIPVAIQCQIIFGESAGSNYGIGFDTYFDVFPCEALDPRFDHILVDSPGVRDAGSTTILTDPEPGISVNTCL